MSDNYNVSVENDFVSANLDEVGTWDGGSGPVPQGDYLVEVSAAERKTSAAGNSMLAVELTILGQPNGGATEAEGRKLFANYVETGKKGARMRLKNFLVAADRLSNGGYAPSQIKGARLVVGVTHEPYEKEDIESGEKISRVGSRVGKERKAS